MKHDSVKVKNARMQKLISRNLFTKIENIEISIGRKGTHIVNPVGTSVFFSHTFSIIFCLLPVHIFHNSISTGL